jgi:hypothetical protein
MRNLVFLLISTVVLLSSCGNEPDTTYIGNWYTVGESKASTRNKVASFTIGDTIAYFIGGYYYKNKEYWRKDVWKAKINSLNNLVWTRIDSLPSECLIRTGSVAFAIGTKGYYGLGYSGQITGKDSAKSYTYLSDFWQLDPSQPSGSMWTQMADYPSSSNGIEGAIGFGDNVNNIGIVLGGNHDMMINETYTFDPNSGAKGTWTEQNGTSLQYNGNGRMNGSSFTIKNKTYVFGGINSSNEYQYDFFVYDPSTLSWTRLNDIADKLQNESFDDNYTMQRIYGCTFVLNDKGYLTLGYKSGILIDTWEYNPNDDRWTRKTAFENTARNYATGFAISNRAFVCFGSNGSSYYNGVYEFQPDAEIDDYDN